MSLNKFRLLSETPDHYEVASINGTSFKLEKSKLSTQAQKLVKGLKSGEAAKYAQGGQVTAGQYDGRSAEEKALDERHEKGRAADEVIMKSATERLDLNDPAQKRRWERMNALLNPNAYAQGGQVSKDPQAELIVTETVAPVTPIIAQPATVDEMATMALPNQMSTIAQSDAAMEQRLRNEEGEGLTNPEFSPDEFLIGAALGPAKAVTTLGSGLIESQAGKAAGNAVKETVEAGTGRLLQMADMIKNESLSKIGSLPSNIQEKIINNFDNALAAARDHLGEETVNKLMRLDARGAMQKLAALPEMRAARQAMQNELKRSAGSAMGNVGTSSIKTDQPNMFAEGGQVEEDSDLASFIDNFAKNYQGPIPGTPLASVPGNLGPMMSQAQAPTPIATAPVAAPTEVIIEQPQIAPEMSMSQEPQMTMDDIVNQRKAALNATANAIAGQGQAEVNAIDALTEAEKNLPSQQDIIKKNEKIENDLFKAYQDTKIDPNRYFANQSTGSKILSAIAMALGGAGAAVAGQENLAAKVAMNAINADIDAQKADKSAKMNLWKMNKQKLGSDLEANLATRNQLLTGLKYQVMRAGSAYKGPLAAAKTQEIIASINQDMMKNRQLSALANFTKESTGGQGMSEQGFLNHTKALQMVGDPKFNEMYKEKMKNYIPGVGITKKPPTEKDMEFFKAADTVKEQIKGLQALITKGPTVSGSVADTVNQAKVAGLQMNLKNYLKLGVLSEQDFEMLKKLTADPGAWWSQKSMAKLDAVLQDVVKTEKSTEKFLGLTRFDRRVDALKWLKENPNAPQAEAIRKKLGVK